MNILSPEVIATGLAAGGAVVTGFMGWLVARERSKVHILEHKRAMAEREMDFQAAALSFPDFAEEYDQVMSELRHLTEETSIDRILVLRAWNGYLRPKWTTAILQVRRGDQEPISYVHYELDDDYVDRLRQMAVGKRPISWKTEEMPSCGIKDIYMMEGVRESLWGHIGTKQLGGTNTASVTYASFSTGKEAGFNEEDKVKATLSLGRLKGIYNAFESGVGGGRIINKDGMEVV